MTAKVLVTGGAGYIGSHVVRQLGEAGRDVVVLDNLSNGNADAVLFGELVVGDTGDQTVVRQLLADHRIEAVLHFAALTVIAESVKDPLAYYSNNTCSTRNLLQCCQEAGVRRFIFSSTAAVYGASDVVPLTETAPTIPINPYGTSKLMSEWMLRDLGAAGDMDYVVLRYFNVAGSDPKMRIGQSTTDSSLLIKVACEVATGKRDRLFVFGTDYDTADGTGVRDYIHVEDLADVHLRALEHLESGGESLILNCGYGHGYSVREVINAVETVSGCSLPITESPRRAGDPGLLCADSSRLQDLFGWQPRYDDLLTIVRHALAWERKLSANR